MKVNPYLFFNGDCEAAFRFYEQALGGQIVFMEKHRGSPAEAQVPAEWQDKVLHARLVAGGNVLMGSDAPPDRAQKPQGFSLSLSTDGANEAERVFRALADGGTETMPMEETFFAARFGMCVDRFGIPWMVVCEKPA